MGRGDGRALTAAASAKSALAAAKTSLFIQKVFDCKIVLYRALSF
jgi:hypothetical protein